MPKQPTVHILLATYNGERFLTEQLESISRQTYHFWKLTVSDDGSTDETLALIERFASQVQQPVTLLQGPSKGSSTANFFHLISNAPIDSDLDLYAFCDQDDVWHDDKLERAVKWHAQNSDQHVRLYFGRTEFVDENLQPIGLSPSIKRPPSFSNALVENIASGNTIVMSQTVLVTQRKILHENSVWHDWTAYLVATALGGKIWFDEIPSVLYRQHADNVIGSNVSLTAIISQIPALLTGRYRRQAEVNLRAITSIANELHSDNVDIFKYFQKMLYSTIWILQFKYFLQSDIRRQNSCANFFLGLGLLLGLFKKKS